MEQIRSALKESARIRWSILLLIASVQAANYYFYDALSPLKRLMEESFNITSTNYGLLVAAYSIPNTFLLMAVLGGVILDKLGIRRTGFLFVGMMAIGGLITAYGASEYFSNGGFGYGLFNSFLPNYSPELKMMILGRFFFGLGAETSIVVVSKVIVKWFKGKELALAFGMKIGLARAGSALAIFFSAEIAEYASHWTIAIWFAAMLLLIAFLAFMVYTIFDVKIDKQLNEGIPVKKEEGFSFADLRKLLTNKSFIYVTLLCLTFYSAVFPFQAFSPDFLFNKFGMSLTQSGKIASILYWVTMFATPLFGLVVDKFGKSATLMIFGAILITLVHITFALTYFNPVVLLVLLGIAIALVPAAMWPSVAKIVPEHRIGTAYGAMFSIQNLGLFAVPILAGTILDGTNKFSSYYNTPIQTNEIIMNNCEFQSDYLDNDSMPRINKKLIATTYILAVDDTVKWKNETGKILSNKIENEGQTIWSEYENTRTNAQGVFDAFLGKGKILSLDISYLSIYSEKYLISIRTKVESKPVIYIFDGMLVYTPDSLGKIPLNIDVGNEIFSELDSRRFEIEVSITDTTKGQNILVYQELHDINCKKKNSININLGEGYVKFANINYIDWTMDKNYFIKVRTPLDYTITMILFAIFGFIGLVFAFLLKREDKTSGYGLELPSNAKVKSKK